MWRILLIGILVPNLAYSAGFKHRVKDPNAPPLPVIENYCRDGNGERKELGEVICITASCNTWMAKCDMSLNNAIWRKVQDGCPTAGLLQRLENLKPNISTMPKRSGLRPSNS